MRSHLGRVGWAFVDQAAVSLTSFLVVFVAARTSSVDAFGAFALALSYYYLALTLTRALTSEVALIAVPRGDSEAGRLAQQAAITMAFGWGIAGLTLAVVASAELRGALVPLSAVLPLLVAQDVRRSLLIAERRMPRAAMSSLVVLTVLVVAGSAAVWWLRMSLPWLVVAWGLGCGVSLAVMGRGWRWPSPRSLARWLQGTREFWPRFSTEAMAAAGAGQVAIMLATLLGGLPVAAGIRGAALLMTPLTVSQQAASQFLTVEASRLRPSRYRDFIALVAIAFLMLGAVTTALALTLPEEFLSKVVGESLSVAQVALPGMSLYLTVGAMALGAIACFRVSGRVPLAWRIRIVTAPSVLLAPLLVARADDPVRASALGFAAAGLVAALAWSTVVWREVIRPRKGQR